MKQYQLKIKNNYGNSEVAIFNNAADLIKYTVDNPLEEQYQYYVRVIETIYTRISMDAMDCLNCLQGDKDTPLV